MLNLDYAASSSDSEADPASAAPLPEAGLDADATMQQQEYEMPREALGEEACLVQIYPADVIDGMLLLESDVLRIGRDIACELALDDSNVSRRHAEIHRHEDGDWLHDLGSTNGTLVNGQAIENHQLQSGDRIAIGSFIFKYLSAGSVESQYHEAVYMSLTRDALTGTMNKRYLAESLQREIARARRGGQPLAMVMIDIDHFKSINDTHGHLVGDEVLREFGERLLSICREDDLLARYGGEEFSLLLASTTRNDAIEIAERCRDKIATQPFPTAAGPLAVTASFGIECYDGDSPISPEALVGAADARLYAAKQGGRNRVVG